MHGVSLHHLISSSLLRTPSANEPGVKTERLQTKDGEPAKLGERAYDRETGRNAQVGLSQQLAMLPTPQARDYRSPDLPESGNLQRKVAEGYTIDLNSRIAMLPTPGSADGKTAYMGENREGRQENVETVIRNSTGGPNLGLKLQPGFVEWMMGYPIGYTDLKPSEIASCPK
jgi:hypothetical protein